MRFILLIKLCLCIFGNIPGIFSLFETSLLLLLSIGEEGLVLIRFRNILNTYVLYLLITTILRFAIVRKSNRHTNVYLQKNEFIMFAVLQIYFHSTITRRNLSKIILYIMWFILLIKLCLCILGGYIPGIFTPMRKGPYGNFSKTEK